MAAVCLIVCLKPGLAPRLPKSPLHERMASLKTGLPIMGIFFLVIGGIYGGVFTATEGGGIGAFGTLLLSLCMRRMNRKTSSPPCTIQPSSSPCASPSCAGPSCSATSWP